MIVKFSEEANTLELFFSVRILFKFSLKKCVCVKCVAVVQPSCYSKVDMRPYVCHEKTVVVLLRISLTIKVCNKCHEIRTDEVGSFSRHATPR